MPKRAIGNIHRESLANNFSKKTSISHTNPRKIDTDTDTDIDINDNKKPKRSLSPSNKTCSGRFCADDLMICNGELLSSFSKLLHV